MRSQVAAVMQIYTVAFHVTTMCNLGDGYKNLMEHTAAIYGVPLPFIHRQYYAPLKHQYLPTRPHSAQPVSPQYVSWIIIFISSVFLNDMYIMHTT